MSEEWKAQYNKAGRLWFWGVDVQENPGGTPEAWLTLPIRPLRMTLSWVGSPMLAPSTISCLTTSNLPWFMHLTFQVPMQYCSLQHLTLLLSPVTSTADYCFCFGSIPSFFLELFLHWSPVAYWAPTNLGNSSLSILSFYLFILFMGFSRQEYWSGLPFSSPVDHILSDLSTMTHPSWVAPHGMA